MAIKQYYPELDKIFNEYWTAEAIVENSFMSLPAVIEEKYAVVKADNFFNLLFATDTYEPDNYVYFFSKAENVSLSADVVSRIKSSYNTIYTYYSDSSSAENILVIDSEIVSLLELLLDFRKNSTADLSSIVYDDLETVMGKLIYIYLDMMINDNYDRLNTVEVFSENGKLLETLYEAYLINEAYKRIKAASDVSLEVPEEDGIIIDGSTGTRVYGDCVIDLVELYSGTYTASNCDFIFVHTDTGNPVTIYLPGSPSYGDKVYIFDKGGTASTNNITIERNGERIYGDEENLLIDSDQAFIVMTYELPDFGWRTEVEFSEPTLVYV